MSLVSFTKINGSGVNSIKQAVLECLNLINYSFEKDVSKVVIKPNLCYYWDYTTGQTTDPKLTSALIELLRERISPNVDISIVESDASAMKCKHVFKMLGYEKLSKDCNVKLINLSEDKRDVTEVIVKGHSFNLMVPRTIRNADLKINVPKIKYTMEEIKITCALKNIFGCNPYPRKFKYHPHLKEAIVASNKAMKFDLCIIDANIVSGIQPRRLGLIMSSRDPVAADAAAAIIAGINPRAISYLQLAKAEGLGNDRFIPKGEPINYFRDRYPRKSVSKKLVGKIYSLVTQTPFAKRLGLQ